MDNADVVAVAEQMSAFLRPGDLDETLRSITAAAVEVLPMVQFASITVRHPDGRLTTAAPTADVLCVVDAAQYELREGPCYETVTDAVHVTAPWLAQDDRFPHYRAVAVQAGIQAQAGIRLFESDLSIGALNLYSSAPGAFQDLAFLGELVAHQAALALRYAREVDQLRSAVETRGLIGQAVGIAMERYELTDERAFALLTRLSSHTGVALRDVAQGFVEAGRARAL